MAATEGSTGRTYRGATSGERRDRRRDELVSAGIEVFGTRGYRTATVEQVCLAAGLTKRYFYESFSDREELLIASYRESSDRMLASVDAAASAGASTSEHVTGVLTAPFDFCRAEPEMTRIVLFEVLGVSDAVDAEHRASTDRFIAAITRADDRAGVGDLDEELRHLLGGALVGAALQLLREWVLQDHTPAAESVIDALRFTTLAVLDRVADTRAQPPPR